MVITYAGWDTASRSAQVGAYGEGIDVAGGRCTFTMTLGQSTQAVSRTASQDAKTVQCGTLAIPASSLAPGRWSAVVSYRSSDRAGVSAPVVIEVPA